MSSSGVLEIEVAEPFEPLLQPMRYKGAHGGRGSGKSHFFAEQAVSRCVLSPGTRGVCIREVQKDLKDSAKLLIEDKIRMFGLTDDFRVVDREIRTPGGGLIIFRGMKDYTADSIKSLEGFDWAWVEEAHTLSSASLEMLDPTLRKPGAELWFSWNPRSASDPVDMFLRGPHPPPDSIVVRVNYNDNPFFPEELEKVRRYHAEHNRDRYAHIWLGEYEPMAVGAIWDRLTINEGRRSERPGMTRIVVAVDPAVSADEGANEHGIIVAGLGADGRGYVLDDGTTTGGPQKWANRAVAMFDLWDADAIVVEVNQGGDMVKHTLQTVRPDLRVIEVRASRGKHVRAEPIAALYTIGRVSHVGTFPELEDQMCLMTAAGWEGPEHQSPDRVDALVWAMTELFPAMTTKQNVNLPASAESDYGMLTY